MPRQRTGIGLPPELDGKIPAFDEASVLQSLASRVAKLYRDWSGRGRQICQNPDPIDSRWLSRGRERRGDHGYGSSKKRPPSHH